MKNILKSCFFVFSVMFNTLVFAQQFEWIKETWPNRGGEMSISPNQNLYVEGTYPHSHSTVNGVSLNNLGYPHEDFYVAKYDLDGNLLWVRSSENGESLDFKFVKSNY
jgi:hypothetical protein